MSKKILKAIFPEAQIKKVFFHTYDYDLIKDHEVFHIKILNVNKNTILSINSKFIWEIKTGKPSGISFKTTSSTLINLKEFNKKKNKIIVFKEKPYKILKYINESEVVNISNQKEINDIKIFNSFKEIDL
jgi:hypothetical protein